MTLINKVRSSSIARFLLRGTLLTLPLAPVTLAEEAPDPERLTLASVSAAVAPIGAETPFYTKRADWSMPIASVTKLMTGLVVLESGASLDEWLTVEERHFPPAANAFSRLRPGSEAQRGDLLRIEREGPLPWHDPHPLCRLLGPVG